MHGKDRTGLPKSGDPPDPGAEDSEPREPVHLPIEGILDLHAFNPSDVRSVVDEYIRASHGAGLLEVRLVHGRGTGVLRGIVQQALDQHPLVAEFWDAPESHLGATVARLVSSWK